MPRPPMTRAAMNVATFGASADPTAPIKYSTPIQSSVALRPKRSVGHPPISEPDDGAVKRRRHGDAMHPGA